MSLETMVAPDLQELLEKKARLRDLEHRNDRLFEQIRQSPDEDNLRYTRRKVRDEADALALEIEELEGQQGQDQMSGMPDTLPSSEAANEINGILGSIWNDRTLAEKTEALNALLEVTGLDLSASMHSDAESEAERSVALFVTLCNVVSSHFGLNEGRPDDANKTVPLLGLYRRWHRAYKGEDYQAPG